MQPIVIFSIGIFLFILVVLIIIQTTNNDPAPVIPIQPLSVTQNMKTFQPDFSDHNSFLESKLENDVNELNLENDELLTYLPVSKQEKNRLLRQVVRLHGIKLNLDLTLNSIESHHLNDLKILGLVSNSSTEYATRDALSLLDTNLETLKSQINVLDMQQPGKTLVSRKGLLQDAVENAKADGGGKNMMDSITKNGDIQKQGLAILNSLYQGFQDNWTQADLHQIWNQIGIGILDIGLACADLGFLIGPLNNLLNSPPFKASPPPAPDPNAVLARIINTALDQNGLRTFCTTQQTQFAVINTQLSTYNYEKYGLQTYCPPDVTCSPVTPGIPTCDPIAVNNSAVACMRTPDEQNPSVKFDPSMLRLDETNSEKRQKLLTILNDPAKPLYQMLFSGNQSIDGMNLWLGNGCGTGATIQFLKPFLVIIGYLITYYHEISMLDLSVVGTGFKNPWMSLKIGTPSSLYQASSGGWLTSAQGQPVGSLLGDLQVVCNKYQTFIEKSFMTYWTQLQVGNQDNGCCGSNQYYPDCWFTSCNNNLNWNITDMSGQGAVATITRGDNGTPDWYGLMRTKYNWAGPYQPGTSDWHAYDSNYTTDGLRIRLMYMRFFNEYLNYPCDTLVALRKMAGYDDGNLQGSDLLNNILYDCCMNPPQPNPAGSVPQDPTIGGYLPPKVPFGQNNFSLSGGYPFGLNGPSYRSAILKNLNLTQAVPNYAPVIGPTDQDDTYAFGSYCTPMVSLTPNQAFDARLFNIDGDANASTPWVNALCSDPATIGAISCAKAVVSPGTTGTPNANSRDAFCVNINGGTSLLTKIAPPPPSQKIFTYSYTGSQQSLSIVTAGLVTFEIWGAGGGLGGIVIPEIPGIYPGGSFIGKGGNGGYQKGTFQVNAGDLLSFIVGGGGSIYNLNSTSYGGGGAGSTSGGGGGGRSAILLNNTNEIVTAGGGGGGSIAGPAGATTFTIYQGGFSGSQGYNQTTSTVAPESGSGGSSTAGGAGGVFGNSGNPGYKYNGGTAHNNAADSGGGGGGGGYFGGGSGGSLSNNGGANGSGGASGGGGGNFAGPGVNIITVETGTLLLPGGTTSPAYPGGNVGYGTTLNVNSGGNGYIVITLP